MQKANKGINFQHPLPSTVIIGALTILETKKVYARFIKEKVINKRGK